MTSLIVLIRYPILMGVLSEVYVGFIFELPKTASTVREKRGTSFPS